MTWKNVPFVRLLVPVVLGIVLGEYMPYSGSNWTFSLLLLLGILLGSLLLRISHFRWRILYGFFLNSYLIFLAWGLTSNYDERTSSTHFQNQINLVESPYNQAIVELAEMPQIKEKRTKIRATLKSIKKDSTWINSSGSILLYLENDTNTLSLKYGDRLVLSSFINKIPPPNNPHAFDYARFLHYQNIHYQSFISKKSWAKLDSQKGNAWQAMMISLRKTLLHQLKIALDSPNEFAVGAALVLGYKSEMTEDVQLAYANTGAMHVLAVSGLHVGIVYTIIMWLLGFVKSKKTLWLIVKAIIAITFLWFFAFLTGASPSVMRASLMFSLFIVANTVLLPNNIYNTIASSAFVLLLINPYLLYSVGFQLSYLAVLSIVYFQPWIYGSWYVPTKLGKGIWALMSVSLAAQIGTLPISLYYFHQFPVYFLLSGLVVVPAAGVILHLGLGLFLSHLLGIGFLTQGISWLLYWIIWVMNALIFYLENLPFAIIKHLWIGPLEVGLLYAFILCIILAKEWRSYTWVLGALGLLVLTCGSWATRSIQNHHSDYIAIYDASRGTIIDAKNGTQAFSLLKNPNNEKINSFASLPLQQAKGIATSIKKLPLDTVKINIGFLYKNENYLGINGKRIVIIDEDYFYEKYKGKLQVDYLLLTNKSFVRPEALKADFEYQKIILDTDNTFKSQNYWQQYTDSLDIPSHIIRHQGAFLSWN